MSGDDLWRSGESGSGVFNYTDNLTLTCAAQEIRGPVVLPFSQSAAIAVRVIRALQSFIIVIFGILLNSMVLLVVGKFKKLQTPSFSIGFQVVIFDLLLALYHIFALASAIAGRWPFGEALCVITGLFHILNTIMRTFFMLVLVIDRFLTIFSPFLYPKYSSKIIVCLSLLSWMVSILLTIPPLPGILDCYTFSSASWFCMLSGSCNVKCKAFSNFFLRGIMAPLTDNSCPHSLYYTLL